MTPDEFKHGVQRGVNNRKIGSAPNLGPVPQLTRIGRVREGVSRRRSTRSLQQRPDMVRSKRRRSRHRVIAVWSSILGLIAFAALAVIFFLWLKPMLARERDTTEKDRAAADSRIRKASKFPSPGDRESLAIVKRALAVRDPNKVAAVIRPGPLTNEEVVAQLEAIEKSDGEIDSIVWLGSVDKNGLSLEGLDVKHVQGEQVRRRLAMLTPDEEGVWKLDIAAYARLVDPNWDKILKGDASRATVRVSLAQDRYYNGPFADDTKWVAYGMVSPDMNDLLVGYCIRDSPQHRALELMWLNDQIEVLRATLEIRRVEGAERRQFEITQVLAEDWVMAEETFQQQVELDE